MFIPITKIEVSRSRLSKIRTDRQTQMWPDTLPAAFAGDNKDTLVLSTNCLLYSETN